MQLQNNVCQKLLPLFYKLTSRDLEKIAFRQKMFFLVKIQPKNFNISLKHPLPVTDDDQRCDDAGTGSNESGGYLSVDKEPGGE